MAGAAAAVGWMAALLHGTAIKEQTVNKAAAHRCSRVLKNWFRIV
jgi:hypothetical protein